MHRTLAAIIAATFALCFLSTESKAVWTNDGRVIYSDHAAPRKAKPVRVATHVQKPKQTHLGNSQGQPITDLSARRMSRHHVRYSRGGACDGFTRCRCGTTAARNFGISYAHNGWNLKMASEWRRFPRTGFAPGVAGVQSHHVLKIVGGSSCSNATVTDDAGTYQRNVCNMTFHSVSGGGDFTQVASSPRRGRTHTMSARSHYQHYALHEEAPFDRHGFR